MAKMFNFKKLSWKIALIVGVTVVVVTGAIAAYMQNQILSEIDRNTQLHLQLQLQDAAEKCDLTLLEAVSGVAGMKKLAEVSFVIDEYTADAESYFNNEVKTIMSGYLYNIVDRNPFFTASYLSIDPDLAGYPYVCELYFEETGDGIEEGESQEYEEYMDVDSEDMEWFYGAFSSGKPYWTGVYEWVDGTFMVSYVEPVVVDNNVIGVVGLDISIDHIEELIQDIVILNTGFAVLADNNGDFLETNDMIRRLSREEIDNLLSGASENEVFEIKLDGVNYMAARTKLVSGYTFCVLVQKSETTAEATASLIRFGIIFVTALAVVLIVSYFIGKTISRPLVILADFMNKAGTTGDIKFKKEDIKTIESLSMQKDEIGQCIGATANFVEHVINIADELETIASGDLTTEIDLLSDEDVMGMALTHTVDNLNALFGEINASVNQALTGAKQVADGAQSLAEGSTEQAGAIEKLSSAIAEITNQIKDNAETAEKTAKLSESIKANAEKGSRQMDEMTIAVKEINDASHSISKILKTIDDIAFQTNILALNASVEAARAGQHGKGFAVVAEEVRNLAAKSAEAAKETGAIIQNSVEKAELGSRITEETAVSLAGIVDGINQSSGLIAEIDKASVEQSASITEINTGIDQVAQVVQQNTATAEESAAASKEMNDQSNMLQELISQFKLKKDNKALPEWKD